MSDLKPILRQLFSAELERDGWRNDRTSLSLFGTAVQGKAVIRAKEPGVFCGEHACEVMAELSGLRIEASRTDGGMIRPKDIVVRLVGGVQQILSVERTLLNLLSHLCGVASETHRFVEAAQGAVRILATRKTLPGLRDLQLKAVEAGGGTVRRTRLDEGILIKDNHLVLIDEVKALKRAKASERPKHGVEIEVESMEALEKALKNTPDVIMLDNMGVDKLRAAIERIRSASKEIEIEISGGVSLEQVPILSKLGADSISVGRITHSVMGIDLSLEMLTGK